MKKNNKVTNNDNTVTIACDEEIPTHENENNQQEDDESNPPIPKPTTIHSIQNALPTKLHILLRPKHHATNPTSLFHNTCQHRCKIM